LKTKRAARADPNAALLAALDGPEAVGVPGLRAYPAARIANARCAAGRAMQRACHALTFG
jgi:hypothetical protein